MSRDLSALMFDADEIKRLPPNLLPRLIRIIYFRLGITNEEYRRRYHEYAQENEPQESVKKITEQASSNAKFIRERSSLTFNMLHNAIDKMGYDLETVTVTLRDRLTGDKVTCSTDDTLQTLQDQIAKEKEIGVRSLS